MSAGRPLPAMLRRIALLVLLVVLSAGCTKRDPAPAAGAAPQILRLSQRNEPADLDPARVTLPDEFAILRALSEGLLVPGPAGTAPLPGAAERFAVSPDGLVYTFHLRRGAVWSNGDPLTAADFVASYRRLLTPATAAPKANVFFAVKNARAFATGALADFASVGLRAADPHTLVVTLDAPNPRFPHTVASGPWLPVHVPSATAHGRRWTQPEHFVGNGPFVLAAWRGQQRLVVRKNPRWHGAAGVRLDEIRFERFDSGDTEERAYRAGQIDVTMAVPQSKLDVYARERPAELHRAPMIETRYLVFNTRRPPLDDPRVRRALALAIDRQRLVDRVTRGAQPIATRFVPEALRGTGVPPVGPSPPAALTGEFTHDPAGARALFTAAGVTAKPFPQLEVTAWSSSQVPTLEAIQAMWRETLGLEVAIALRDAKVHLDALATGAYDIGFITSIPDIADPANMLGDFATGAPENYPQWSDAAFDAALARGDFAGAETRLLEAAVVAPLYFNTKIWLMSPRVRGWTEDGLWSRTYHGISLAEK